MRKCIELKMGKLNGEMIMWECGFTPLDIFLC